MSTNAGELKNREVESGKNTFALLLINKKSWWAHFLIVMVISLSGLLYLGRVI